MPAEMVLPWLTYRPESKITLLLGNIRHAISAKAAPGQSLSPNSDKEITGVIGLAVGVATPPPTRDGVD